MDDAAAEINQLQYENRTLKAQIISQTDIINPLKAELIDRDNTIARIKRIVDRLDGSIWKEIKDLQRVISDG